MATTGGRKGERTKDLASLSYAVNNVFLLNRVSHRDLHVPLEPQAQSKSVIIVALGSNVQNPAHTKALKLSNMLLSCDLRA